MFPLLRKLVTCHTHFSPFFFFPLAIYPGHHSQYYIEIFIFLLTLAYYSTVLKNGSSFHHEHLDSFQSFVSIKCVAINSFMHKSFCTLPMCYRDRFFQVGCLQHPKVNKYILLLSIVKFPFIGVVPFCICSSLEKKIVKTECLIVRYNRDSISVLFDFAFLASVDVILELFFVF